MRRRLAWQMILLGFVLQFVSYFFLAAPLGLPREPVWTALGGGLAGLSGMLAKLVLPSTPSSPAYADPRLPFAPAVFIVGVMLVFLAAVAYELLPDRQA